ncbi:MAG: hypothetical protein IT214_02000 [Chitinophagaceae bacterium]|nr:hypothetical protein [Chitinophagaceae bacterium]OQY94392.1 MAG: hypothetical protein B6D37_09070 [Sphingobacteriales bacterium UTBCD1]
MISRFFRFALMAILLMPSICTANPVSDTSGIHVIIVSVSGRPVWNIGNKKIRLKPDTTINVKDIRSLSRSVVFLNPNDGFIKYIVKGSKEVATINGLADSNLLAKNGSSNKNSTATLGIRGSECYLSITSTGKKSLTPEKLENYLTCAGQYYNWGQDTICLFTSKNAEMGIDSAQWLMEVNEETHSFPVFTKGNCMVLKPETEFQNSSGLTLIIYAHNEEDIRVDGVNFQDIKTQVKAMQRAGWSSADIADELARQLIRIKENVNLKDFLRKNVLNNLQTY